MIGEKQSPELKSNEFCIHFLKIQDIIHYMELFDTSIIDV